MNPETVYGLLVEANPVPDPSAIAVQRNTQPSRPDDGSKTMLTVEPKTQHSSRKNPHNRGRLVAIAASVALIVAIGALLLARDDTEPSEPAGPVVTGDADVATPATREEAAVATATDFYQAVSVGDVDTAIAMSNPEYTDLEKDRQMWEMNAVTATEGEPWTIGSCEPTASVNSLFIEIGCEVMINDPVWQVLGVSELVAPVRVFDDLTTVWRPFEGADFGAANRAYAEYLRIFHATEYDAVCSPAAYEQGAATQSSGLALTGPCAEVWVPLADEVAQWVADGRPQP